MAEDGIIKRLDTMISILLLAYRNEIVAARTEIRSDSVNAAILEITDGDFVSAGDLKKRAITSGGVSSATVSRRILELVSLGAIEKRGAGSTTSYKATGLI